MVSRSTKCTGHVTFTKDIRNKQKYYLKIRSGTMGARAKKIKSNSEHGDEDQIHRMCSFEYGYELTDPQKKGNFFMN